VHVHDERVTSRRGPEPRDRARKVIGETPNPAAQLQTLAESGSGGLTLRIPDVTIRRFYICLFGMNVLLILMTLLSDLEYSVVDNAVSHQLDLERERNFAVWYSSTVLVLTSLAAGAVSRLASGSGRDKWLRYLWIFAALVFLWLAMDETVGVHERLGTRFTREFGTVPGLTTGATDPVFAWLLVFLPFAILFVASILLVVRWCFRLSARSGQLVLVGTICWVGVLCAEFVEAQLDRWSVEKGLLGSIEECLEITGTTLFLIAFIELLRAADRGQMGLAVHNRREQHGERKSLAGC
jgi:hypothetical protein